MRRPFLALFAVLLTWTLFVPVLEAQELLGSTHASISSVVLSSLGIHIADLEQEVCNLSVIGPDRGAVLVITNDGGGVHAAAIRANVVASTSSPDREVVQVWVMPTDLAAVGAEPLVLACGTYTYRLRLNAAVSQPISPLTLAPASTGATHGIVTGILSLYAELLLEPVRAGSPFQQAHTLGLRINGHYSLLRVENLRSGDSRLQLFATEIDGQPVSSPAWVEEDDPNTRLYLETPEWRLPPPE